jgi:geranylgeranyl diphosphate synthase type II
MSTDPFQPLETIERALSQAIDSTIATPRQREAMAYSVLGGGKRLRPVLCWHACEAMGTSGSASMTACVALEFVHCFSLVHDDLPALDNDDLRRGRPTLHKHAGEAMAILAGDALLNAAMDFASRSATDATWPRAQLERVRLLSMATAKMIAGQVADTLHEPMDSGASPLETLRAMHQHKTGALITASCLLGAWSAAEASRTEPDAKQLLALTTYGEAIGEMFQAVDDLLDVTQSAEHTGKRTKKDADAGKLTFPGLLGVDATKRHITKLLEESRDAIFTFGASGQTLAQLATYLAERTK